MEVKNKNNGRMIKVNGSSRLLLGCVYDCEGITGLLRCEHTHIVFNYVCVFPKRRGLVANDMRFWFQDHEFVAW